MRACYYCGDLISFFHHGSRAPVHQSGSCGGRGWGEATGGGWFSVRTASEGVSFEFPFVTCESYVVPNTRCPVCGAAVDRPIDRKTIQAFIGLLAGQGVSKGIFITTSTFAESAREFVQRGSQTKIVLIDGQALMDLMLRHHVGIRTERTVEILDLDQNYFEDGD